MARDAEIVAIQVFSKFYCGPTPCILSWTSDQILGLERVLALSGTYNIAAVNMSLGGGAYATTADCDAKNSVIKAAIDNLRSAGIATVIAAGNNGYTNALSAPGCISSAVSVGSSSNADAISSFSNEAPFLSLYAPGEAINSSVPLNQFAIKWGTSMATPHVAGAWAILKQKLSSGPVDEILSALQNTGVPLTSFLGTWTTPRIQVDAALDAINIESDPVMALDSPIWGSVVSVPFTLFGWAIDKEASSGTGVDKVDAWAFPDAGGAPIFLGSATLGGTRPDVAALYGESRFTPSGFSLSVITPLAPGNYSIQVFARSTATGTFNNMATTVVTVQSLTNPWTALDTPAPGRVVTVPFDVQGWAIDGGSLSGTGVGQVDVWAFPSNGSPAIFMGSAILGGGRPDVAALFGHSRFTPCGYALSVTNLTPGQYTIQAFARSTVTGTFNGSKSAFITVQTLVSDPLMALDTPTTGSILGFPFTVQGWAIDRGAPSGTGVDQVDVWAFPQGGGSPIFLGTAALGVGRPDVAAVFADPRFSFSGYNLMVNGGLPSGQYTLTAFARSTVTGTFNHYVSAEITVP